MLFIIVFINIIKIVSGDLIKEPNYNENDIPIEELERISEDELLESRE